MDTLQIRNEALRLPESQRASLAADLLESLDPAPLDTDDGPAEARRRIDEMKRDPSIRRTWDQIKAEVGK